MMLPLPVLITPADAAELLAKRLRAERRRQRWTQAELARRSGLSVATIARFERGGEGQVASLLAVFTALGRLDDLDGLLRPPRPGSLDDLRKGP